MPLFICATPIGNLEDVSLRLLRTLKEADLILAEDTRRARKLLSHYDIHTKLTSFHEYSEIRKLQPVLALLKEGKSIALVTDAGTPCVADPGARLVNAAYREGIDVVPIPGPSAVITALSVSGIPMNGFSFFGFVPKKGREAFLLRMIDSGETAICFESPHRIKKTLYELAVLAPERGLILCRELTKKHEEIMKGTSSEMADCWEKRVVKGEFVLIVNRKEKKE
ncbi:MAG: 16S rRNA (cytidine(1402)-2'-O)-methyltransferase [Nanoarchaeota archaeon]